MTGQGDVGRGRRLEVRVEIADQDGLVASHVVELGADRSTMADLVGASLGDGVKSVLTALYYTDAGCTLEDSMSIAARALR